MNCVTRSWMNWIIIIIIIIIIIQFHAVLLPGCTKLGITCCKYVSVPGSGVARHVQKLRHPHVRHMRPTSAAEVQDWKTWDKRVERVSLKCVFSVRGGILASGVSASVRSAWPRNGGQQCCGKCEQQNEKLCASLIGGLRLKSLLFIWSEQVDCLRNRCLGEMRLSYGRSCSAVQLRDEHVWLRHCRGAGSNGKYVGRNALFPVSAAM